MRDEHRGPQRRAIRGAFTAALAAVEPEGAVRRFLEASGDPHDAGQSAGSEGRMWIVGAGKASLGMARGVLLAMEAPAAGGTLAVATAAPELPGIDLWEAGHPIPSIGSLAAAGEALAAVRAAGRRDRVICVLSGGASAMWAAPPAGVSLEDLRALTAELLRCGAPIGEINTVRKRVSRIAGGGLARACRSERLLTLAISDVIGAPDDVIGSGPTLPDRTTARDALDVLRSLGIDAPPAVVRHLESASSPELSAGATRGDFHVVATNEDAIGAAVRDLERSGYHVLVVDSKLQGEARSVGRMVADRALTAAAEGARMALLWGGETTVFVRGTGRGGRNQEVALAAALHLAEHAVSVPVTVGSLATDGRDGPTDAAGAFADVSSVSRIEAAGRDPSADLAVNDSHSALAAAGDLVATGPTGTNVNDLIFAIVN